MAFARFAFGSTCFAITAFFLACGGDDPAPGTAPTGPDGGGTDAPSNETSTEGGGVYPADAPITQKFIGGTRLKPKAVVSIDGERSVLGWFDTLMNVDCSFRLAMDGELRCLPTNRGSDSYWDRGFIANNCMGEAVLVDKREGSARDTCTPNKYFVSADESVCPRKYRVEPVGAESNATSYWYQETNCTQSNLSTGWKLYSLGAESAPTEWVKGTIVNEPAKDGLSASFIGGDDGSLGFYGWVDARHSDAPCGFTRAADGESRCLPFDEWGIVWEDLYSDANCSSYVAQGGLYGKCQTPFGRRYDDRGSCAPKMSVHPIVGPYTGASVYRGTPGACNGQAAGGSEFYLTGPEIPATEFSALVSGDPVGSTRLKRSRGSTSGGWVTGGGFFDTLRNEGCSFTTAKDGKLHCMPSGSFPSEYFADDQCTSQLYRVYEQCGATVPKYGRDLDVTSCPPHARLFLIGDKHTGTVYEKYGTGPCTPNSGSANGLLLYLRSTEVDPSELVEGSEVIGN